MEATGRVLNAWLLKCWNPGTNLSISKFEGNFELLRNAYGCFLLSIFNFIYIMCTIQFDLHYVEFCVFACFTDNTSESQFSKLSIYHRNIQLKSNLSGDDFSKVLHELNVKSNSYKMTAGRT